VLVKDRLLDPDEVGLFVPRLDQHCEIHPSSILGQVAVCSRACADQCPFLALVRAGLRRLVKIGNHDLLNRLNLLKLRIIGKIVCVDLFDQTL
jgi:hypothetical protein